MSTKHLNTWTIHFDWQEDESSPTGGMYYFTAARQGEDLFTVQHHNLSTAWVDTLGELQARKEV
jgi:hypothetical protein